jgi:hypothetical protein
MRLGGPVHALARCEPAQGCLLGAYIEKDGYARGNFAKFEQAVGRRHAVYMDYLAYGEPFPTNWVLELGARGCAAHIAWEPNDGLGPVRDDRYLRTWARAAAATKVPVFVRFASEMNGRYTPYHGNPRRYVEKWRLLARVLREEAPNVALVWCVFYYGPDAISPYYPGDDAVDWVGINIYNVLHHNGQPRVSAAGEDPRTALRRVYGPYAARKPVMICEYGVTHRENLNPRGLLTDFARGKLSLMYGSLASEFPRVKCIQYFSWDTLKARAARNDYSLTDDLRVLARYRELIAAPHFLERVPGFAPLAPEPSGTRAAPSGSRPSAGTPTTAIGARSERGGPTVTAGRSSAQVKPAPVVAPPVAPSGTSRAGPVAQPPDERRTVPLGTAPAAALDLVAQALAAKRAGDRAGAIRLARAALVGDPALVEAWWVLAWALAETGARGEAVAAFETIAQLSADLERVRAARTAAERLR